MYIKKFFREKRFCLWHILLYGPILSFGNLIIKDLSDSLRINMYLAFLVYASFCFNILTILAYLKNREEENKTFVINEIKGLSEALKETGDTIKNFIKK
ncbi:MAG: hypothetical protein JW924_12330 [Fusobacteriaceae bacterium]|nr:hypothetical protein [Fusobacteriaceae bacterium]